MKKIIIILAILVNSIVYGETPDEEILSAAWKSDVAALEAALSKGASINAKNKYTSDTVLMRALDAKPINIDFIKLIIKKGADIHAKNKYGDTPLMVAANNRAKESLEACDLLLSKGADINAVNEQGITALMMVSRVAYRGDSIKFFINKKAELNKRDKDGMTALSWAQRVRNYDGIKILTAAGGR